MNSQSNNQVNKDILSVFIRNRMGFLVQEEVKAITSYNNKGIFDVLPQHTNFISIIKDVIIIHKNDGSKKEIKISKGILKVYANEAYIYLDISQTLPGKI